MLYTLLAFPSGCPALSRCSVAACFLRWHTGGQSHVLYQTLQLWGWSVPLRVSRDHWSIQQKALQSGRGESSFWCLVGTREVWVSFPSCLLTLELSSSWGPGLLGDPYWQPRSFSIPVAVQIEGCHGKLGEEVQARLSAYVSGQVSPSLAQETCHSPSHPASEPCPAEPSRLPPVDPLPLPLSSQALCTQSQPAPQLAAHQSFSPNGPGGPGGRDWA